MGSPRGERPNILRSSVRVIGRDGNEAPFRNLLVALLVIALLIVAFFTVYSVLG